MIAPTITATPGTHAELADLAAEGAWIEAEGALMEALERFTIYVDPTGASEETDGWEDSYDFPEVAQ